MVKLDLPREQMNVKDYLDKLSIGSGFQAGRLLPVLTVVKLPTNPRIFRFAKKLRTTGDM